jgi:hypothetical protein
MILRFRDFVGSRINESFIKESILYKPGVSYWWKGKPMEKFEKAFLHMEDAYRSASVKMRILNPMGTAGDYEFVFKDDSAKPSFQSKPQTGPAFKARPGEGVQPKPELRIVPGTEYFESTDPNGYYATFYLSQDGETGRDTSTVTLFDCYGNFYQVIVGEAAQYDKSNLLRNLLVSKENIVQSGRYTFVIKGSIVTLDFVVDRAYLGPNEGLRFNYNPKMSPNWNAPECFWMENNPFTDKKRYPTEQKKIEAANKFRNFINQNFPEIARAESLSPNRKDSSAYCSENIKNVWFYTIEGGYTLGQFFPYIDDPAFIGAIKGSINDVDRYFTILSQNKEDLAKNKEIQLNLPDKIYNLPGDKNWDYKYKDGVWFAARKNRNSDSEWRSLAGNTEAQKRLNDNFPKASLTDIA